MAFVYDMDKINALLESFVRVTGVHISLFDPQFRGLSALEVPRLTPCNVIRRTEAGRQACYHCDKQAFQSAAKIKTPYIYRCHAGLTEVIAPLYLSNELIGYLIFGKILSYPTHEDAWEKISQCCKKLPISMEDLKYACDHNPLISRGYIDDAIQILSALASYVVLERAFRRSPPNLGLELDAYLKAHYTEQLTTDRLCKLLKIGKTRLYELSRELYGHGIAEEIRRLRLNRAKKLLQECELPISRIAVTCGFSSYNYFIKVFSRDVGVSPRQYQAQFRVKPQ